jgi:hypothetical protein
VSPTDLPAPYRALQAIMQGLEGDALVEMHLERGPRIAYHNIVFEYDKVIGLLWDERLIEYKIVDDPVSQRKSILIYRYGARPDDPFINRRGPDSPSGHWERYFRDLPRSVFQALYLGRPDGQAQPGADRDHLPARKPQAKLLGQAPERPARNPFREGE